MVNVFSAIERSEHVIILFILKTFISALLAFLMHCSKLCIIDNLHWDADEDPCFDVVVLRKALGASHCLQRNVQTHATPRAGQR